MATLTRAPPTTRLLPVANFPSPADKSPELILGLFGPILPLSSRNLRTFWCGCTFIPNYYAVVYHIDMYEVCHNNLIVSNGLHRLCQFWGWRVRIKLWWQERVGLPMVRTAKGRGEQLEEEGPSQWPDVSAWFIHLSHRRWSSREPGKIGPALLGTEVKKLLHQIFGDEIFGDCCTCLSLCYCSGSTKECIYCWRTLHKITKLFSMDL